MDLITSGGNSGKYYAVEYITSTPNSWSTQIINYSYFITEPESDGYPNTGCSRYTVQISNGGTNTNSNSPYSTIRGGVVSGYSDGMEYTPKYNCYIRGVSGNEFPSGSIHYVSAGTRCSWSWSAEQEFYAFYEPIE